MTKKLIAALGLGAMALTAGGAHAQGMDRDTWMQWEAANNETASADRMMSGDVANQFNMLGNVRDLILNEAGTGIEYVLYEVPEPYSFYGSEDGFVRWDNIAIERGVGTGLDLTIDDGASPYAKEELTLTRNAAQHRMVSRILGSNMMFADGAAREITDILFDPDSGMVSHYVVEMDEDSLFDEDMRRVPATMVTMDRQGMRMVAQPTTYEWEIWTY